MTEFINVMHLHNLNLENDVSENGISSALLDAIDRTSFCLRKVILGMRIRMVGNIQDFLIAMTCHHHEPSDLLKYIIPH
jgi:hypothetical protein